MNNEKRNNRVASDAFQHTPRHIDHLLNTALQHFGGAVDAILEKRIVPDMLPFATQIAYTCNQPRNFTLWCEGKEADNLDPDPQSISQARNIVAATKSDLMKISASDSKLEESKRLDFEGGLYVELTGRAYVDDFLIPNMYFHLVTAYDILRMEGVPVGKRDYMMHLAPLVRQG